MSKQNIGKKCGFCKFDHKGLKKQTYNYVLKPATSLKGFSKEEYIFVAPDSNIVFSLADTVRAIKDKQRPIFYDFHNLVSLLRNNVFYKDGTRNENGRIVMVLFPEVYEELKCKDGSICPTVQKLIDKQMVRVNVECQKEDSYYHKIRSLANAYTQRELFAFDGKHTDSQRLCRRFGTISTDGHIAMRGTFNNITVLTQDHHYGVHNGIGITKTMQKLKAANIRIGGDHNGYQAYPMNLNTFFKNISKGNKFAMPENLGIYDQNSQQKLKPFCSNMMFKQPEMQFSFRKSNKDISEENEFSYEQNQSNHSAQFSHNKEIFEKMI